MTQTAAGPVSTGDPDIQLSMLVDMTSPAAVLEEVKRNFIPHYGVVSFVPVRAAFADFIDLFEGRYPGYRGCNTRFHDVTHTTDALLAISRLIDGYNLTRRRKLPADLAAVALIATVFHDAGYIQSSRDTGGTGAKYTLTHVERSIAFMKKYFRKNRLSDGWAAAAENMVRCTGFETDISSLSFGSEDERTLGLMLGTADLLGQMGARTYLERLLLLYREFREGKVGAYDSEHSLLLGTLRFYHGTRERLTALLKDVARYARTHFRVRYGIDEDLYRVSIRRQMEYLASIVQDGSASYRKRLRRKM